MDLTQIKTVGIIGAGISGLATAKTLMAQGLQCALFERKDKLGGVWADGYSNFGVQIPKELYEIPDWPLPRNTPNFTPGPIFLKYLEDYAGHFGILPHIRFGATVDSVAPRGDGKPGWTVNRRSGDGERHEDFDLVVVCSGLNSNIPHMPEFPGQDDFKGKILHISELKSRDQLEGRRVAALGYGKSAIDAALESAAVAKETHLIFRKLHWFVPRNLAGILPFKWGMLNRLTSTIVPLHLHPSRVERHVNGIGKPLVWFYWRLVEALVYFQCRLGSRFGTRESLFPSEPVEVDSFGEALMLTPPDFYQSVRRRRITTHRTEIANYTANGVALKNGKQLDVDVMVLGTGWRCDYGFLPQSTRDAIGLADDGLYLYRQILHPKAPNLAFIGNATTISSLLTYFLQARWLTDLIAGHHKLPDSQSMLDEIEGMKTWKRKWMPFSHARGARLMLHMQHYHDELLSDIGANPLRKTGVFAPLKELLAPYEPSDYATVVSGEWATLEGRASIETAAGR